MASAKRPEHQAPPEVFYNEVEARKYTSNSRMIDIQLQMSERAVELLCLPDDVPCFILDLGCGSGLSGETLTEQGHFWVGVDISPSMLSIANEREVEGDLLLADLGQGLGLKAGSFDGAISISALQWLCNADKKCHSPPKRLHKFFTSLYACLVNNPSNDEGYDSRGSRAVFQFYPENSSQIELITQQSMRAGFSGGVVVDYPNSTKAKKMFLVLSTGGSQSLPKALGAGETAQEAHIKYCNKRERIKKLRGKPPKKSREWILNKKERQRRQGKDVKAESKYTGRKRSGKF